MNTQTIFQVGHSNVVSIPVHLMQELGLKKGQAVVVDKLPDADGISIIPKEKKPTPKKLTEAFNHWLKLFLKEDGDLLDDLATR